MIGSGIFQCSQTQVYVFLLDALFFIFNLTHLTITSLVIFAELCILLLYEVFVLKFR